MKKLQMKSSNLVDANVEKIAKLFPNCVTEAKDDKGELVRKIDFDLLRQELSSVLVEGKDERYRIDWAGKRQAILTANSPIAKTLRPARSESVNFDTTENLYIEGDNLDVLKLLHNTYLGKVKMIYIDPPYNTGSDLVYNDDFTEDAEGLLFKEGQIDDQKNRLVQNKDSSGRFHSDWLGMMYMRLKLAKDILADDGVIFMSIDNNESHNLKKISDEIFGESNFVMEIPILSNPRGRQSSLFFAETHEYLLVYAKSIDNLVIEGEPLTAEQKAEYKEKDARGNYRLIGLRLRGGRATAAESPTLHFPIYYNTKTGDFSVEQMTKEDYEIIPKFEDGTLGTWRWSKKKIMEQKGDLIVKPVKDRFDVFQKDYLTADKRMKLKSLWHEKEINYDNSAREMADLGMGKVFDYAKPLYLVKKIIRAASGNDGIFLDFFSGSATTAHAIMQLNTEDEGTRRFIMVQLPEQIEGQYKTIAEIGKQRIRNAGKKIGKGDVGFRVLKLDDSNMLPVFYNAQEYSQDMLVGLDKSIKDDRTAEDVLFQVMLDKGVKLSSKIDKRTTTNGKQTYYIVGSTDFGIIDLVCVLDKQINTDAVKEIAKLGSECVVFLDSGIKDDATRTNIQQIFDTYSPKTKVEVL